MKGIERLIHIRCQRPMDPTARSPAMSSLRERRSGRGPSVRPTEGMAIKWNVEPLFLDEAVDDADIQPICQSV
jgi:hypothetical protein